MASETISAEHFPRGTSRYTVAMAKCLGSLKPAREPFPTRNIVQALVNLVQGRMLEYLADRICREYDIQDAQLRQRIVSVLLSIFSDEFFALFRTKIDYEPSLVVEIARRIIRKEAHAQPAEKFPSPFKQPADRLYPALFRKYFEYRNLGDLLELVESDADIQKIMLRNALTKGDADPAIRTRVLEIVEDDGDGVAPSLFIGYLDGHDLTRLEQKVRSGAWQAELQALKRHIVHLRGE